MMDFRNLISAISEFQEFDSGGRRFLESELWFKEGLFWLVFSGEGGGGAVAEGGNGRYFQDFSR
jgi:hypothetical protein